MTTRDPAWLREAGAEVEADLRRIAERYPERLELRDGKLQPRRRPFFPRRLALPSGQRRPKGQR